MKVTFLPHSLDRMRQKGISEDDVLAKLRNPDEIGEANMGRSYSRKHIGRRLVWVIYNSSEDEIVVITAMLRRRR